jgi:protein-S-isoprenylcysteine O-methyltransferase Ste14
MPSRAMAAETDFRSTKLYDILVAAPLIVLYSLGIGIRLVPGLFADMHNLPSALGMLDVTKDVSNILYFSLIIGLIVARRVPIAKSQFIWPRVLALTSAYMSIGRTKLPLVHLPLGLDILATVLTAGGTIASIVVLLWLGRSFSILPEARRLVTDGPYRHIRHPLYLVEEIGSLGVMLQFLQPWSLLLEVVNFGLQLWRMQREEIVLTTAFPEYAAYASGTARLIPGVY